MQGNSSEILNAPKKQRPKAKLNKKDSYVLKHTSEAAAQISYKIAVEMRNLESIEEWGFLYPLNAYFKEKKLRHEGMPDIFKKNETPLKVFWICE